MSVRSARGGDTCQLNAAAGTTECTFDATGSTGPITVFRWTYVMAGGTGTHLATTVASSPVTTCALAGGGATLLDDRGAMYTLIEVTLRAGDATGAFGAPATKRVALYTNARCGYPA